jgi:hypothetical protein
LAALFTHTLSFDCPDCKSEISVSYTSTESDRETIDGHRFPIECDTCQKKYNLAGWKAKTHTIKHGHDQQGAFAVIIPPDSDAEQA